MYCRDIIICRSTTSHPSKLGRGATAMILENRSFFYFDLAKEKKEIPLSPGSMAFTYCQVPIVYTLADEQRIHIEFQDGSNETIMGNKLPKELSSAVFERDGNVRKLEVFVRESL